MTTNIKIAVRAKLALIVIGVLLALPVAIALAAPTLTTDKADYAPGETVHISGGGYAAGKSYAVPVLRPDGSIVKGDGSFTPGWDLVSADANGDLVYDYQLDGIFGTYEARAYSADWAGNWSQAPLASVTFTDAPAADLDQCRNGSALSPDDCLDFGGGTGWVNGNAGAQTSHYIEGYSIPYRVRMTELPTDGTSVTIDLGYDVKHSGKHAIDFLTHYQRLQPHAGFGHPAETVDPTSGVSGLSATIDTFPIPAPSSAGSPVAGQPTTRFNSLPAGERVMTLFGGDITNVQYVSQGILTANQSETVIRVTFVPDSATAVLAWGGHIARCADWGTDAQGECNSAAGIDGSPYHMRLKDWSLTNLGNQDRSLSAGAVFATGTVIINKVAVNGNATFNYTATGSGIPASFSITTVGGTGSQTFADILTGARTVTEGALPVDWSFTSLVCSDPDNGTTVNGQTANIDLDANETITCTFTNTRGTPNLTVTKTPDKTDVCNGANTTVTTTYVVTNTGNLALTVNLSDDQLGDIDGGAGFALAPGASQTFTKSATVNVTATNTVTATGTSAGGQTATATATATVTGHNCTISLTKTPSVTDVCNGANTQVTYTYVVTNDSDFFSVSGSVSDDVNGSIGSFGPLAPGASATLTKVATVNGSVTNTGTASGTFDDPASATASASANATVTGHDCTISLTKTPSVTDVCNGANTQVTYTYVVTNNSDFFTWTGTLSDSELGAINGTITLGPGDSQTFTASGTINGTVTNTGTASGTFDDPASTSASASASATVTGHTCKIIVKKVTVPAGDSQPFTFSGDLSGQISDGGTIEKNVQPGTYSTSEAVPVGWDLTSITCDDDDSTGSATPVAAGGTGTATYHVALGETVTCTFTNTKRGMGQVIKLTGGQSVGPDVMEWSFSLTGPDVPGDSDITTGDTQDANGIVDFDGRKLIPGVTYTLCELGIPAGWSTLWWIDDGDGVFENGEQVIMPYNPNASDVPPQDVGNRCTDFTVQPGQTVTFGIDNQFPGGDPRTIGFWKNWNTCTGGRQAETAAKNGGPAAGWFILDDILFDPGITVGDYTIPPTSQGCIEAVRLLDKRDLVTGKKMASDAAYELAAQLIAAQANLAAGAETCQVVQTAVVDAQTLLDQINFIGTGMYLGPKVTGALLTLRNQALALASTLDQYNNGDLCP